MKAAPAALLTFLALAGPLFAQDYTDDVPLQRYLESIRLGDYVKEVKLVYPPVRDWPSYRAPGGIVTCYQVEREYAKHLPWAVDTLRLGFRWGRVAHVQAIYSGKYTREKPLEKLVTELSYIYGEPRRVGMVYFWRDDRTLLRAFNEELPTPDGKAYELRTSVEIMDADIYKEIGCGRSS